MSAGRFIRSRYAASYATPAPIHPIKVQPETEDASIGGTTNAAPGGAITNPISAVTSRGKRERGLKPRTITIQMPGDGQPAGYTPFGTTTIPALTQAFYDLAVPGTTINYLSTDCEVIGRSAEEAE